MVAVDIADALKEPLVQADVVGVLRQDGAQLLGQGVHLVVGLGREQVEEHRRHAAQQVVVAHAVLLVVDADDSVVEGGLPRVVDQLVYLLILPADALHKRLLEVLKPDAVERGHVVGRVVRKEKRVLSFFILTHFAVY